MRKQQHIQSTPAARIARTTHNHTGTGDVAAIELNACEEGMLWL